MRNGFRGAAAVIVVRRGKGRFRWGHRARFVAFWWPIPKPSAGLAQSHVLSAGLPIINLPSGIHKLAYNIKSLGRRKVGGLMRGSVDMNFLFTLGEVQRLVRAYADKQAAR